MGVQLAFPSRGHCTPWIHLKSLRLSERKPADGILGRLRKGLRFEEPCTALPATVCPLTSRQPEDPKGGPRNAQLCRTRIAATVDGLLGLHET